MNKWMDKFIFCWPGIWELSPGTEGSRYVWMLLAHMSCLQDKILTNKITTLKEDIPMICCKYGQCVTTLCLFPWERIEDIWPEEIVSLRDTGWAESCRSIVSSGMGSICLLCSTLSWGLRVRPGHICATGLNITPDCNHVPSLYDHGFSSCSSFALQFPEGAGALPWTAACLVGPWQPAHYHLPVNVLF